MSEIIRLADSVCGLFRPWEPARFSVCFPSPAAIGASGDPEAARELASLIAQSAAEEGIPLLLTPAVNAASRVPDSARSFCFSDDSCLNVKMAAAWAEGLREGGAGAVLRLIPTDSAEDLAALEETLGLCSPCAITAGPLNSLPILLESNASEAALREALERARANLHKPEEFDWGMQHHQARKLARRSAVLLKNDGGLLPVGGKRRVAVIGAQARTGCFRAEGLPPVVCSETYAALQAVRSVWPVTFADGYQPDNDEPDRTLLSEAVDAARNSDLALVFAAARHGSVARSQELLIRAVAEVRPETCVILHTDRPVPMPWADAVPGLMVSFPGGQAAGAADIDLLFGAVTPSGRLPFDFPDPEWRMGAGL